MKIFKYIVIAAISVLTVSGGWFFYNWVDRKGVQVEIPEIASDLKLEGVHMTRSDGERTEWELRAKSADHFRDKELTILDQPVAVFHSKDGRVLELKGQRGELLGNTNDVKLTGNVVITSSDGYILETDSLTYDSKKKQISTESRVTVRGKGINVEGVGMVAYINKDRVVLKKDITAVLQGMIK